ncbi:MAG TPA: N-acetyltransferase [Chloroflexi bacterium]|jgi:amino-acid N-acetyltransferase|nr:N-acetyltransferase [Chloroflexota bacterium]
MKRLPYSIAPLRYSSASDASGGWGRGPTPAGEPNGAGAAPAAGVTVRKATVRDVPTMARIINHWASQGIMLAKSHHQLYQYIRDFVVATHGDVVIGCGALHVVWEDLAEVRSMAVADGWHGKGVGWRMLQCLLDEARELGLPRVFALTYRQSFFARAGFQVVPHESLPHKIWGDCLNCPKYPNCDEIAMTLDLSAITAEDDRAERQ